MTDMLDWLESCQRAHETAKRDGRTEHARVLREMWHQALVKYDEVNPLDFIPVQDGVREEL